MGSPHATGDAGTVTPAPRRPLLAGGLLAGSGLVDVVAAYTNTLTDPYMVVTQRGIYQLDITGWAWLDVAVGVTVILAGLLVVTGRRWTAPVAIGCALVAITIDVVLFPYAPFRAVLMAALNGSAIRLLIRHRRARPRG